jgi:TonB-linked SusC/RagA family outer membrane protein
MKRHLKLAFLLVFVLAGIQQLKAQGKSVSGLVLTEQNEPLIGVSVYEAGTTNGVVTDVDGKFSLTTRKLPSELTVSYLGYVSRTVAVNNQTSDLRVVLIEDSKQLEEVVVIGYGMQKKANVSGSITSVSSRDIHSMSTNDVSQALQGKAPVYIVRNSGSPGEGMSMFIRGANSFRNSNPIWVVDGVKGGPIGNQDEIESIQILKDAASTSIYGVEGANGVIIVTTKQAKGKVKVDYHGYTRLKNTPNLPDLLGTQDYIDMYKARWRSNNPDATEEEMRSTLKSFYFLSPSEVAQFPNTKWADELFKTGFEMVHNVSISGGNDNYTYNITAANQKDDGTIRNTDYSKSNIKMHFSQKLTNWITLSETVSYSSSSKTPLSAQIWSNVYRGLPALKVYDDTNPMGTGYGYFDEAFAASIDWQGGHPLEGLMMRDYYEKSAGTWANIQAVITPFKGFVWTTNVSGSHGNDWNSKFNYNQYGAVPVNNINYVTGKNLQGQQYTYEQRINRSYLVSSFVNYDKTFADKHDMGLTAGLEAGESSNVSAKGEASQGIPAQDLRSTETTTFRDGTNNRGEGSSFSWFARVNYSFDNRYLLSANFRNDYSGNFAPGHRSAFFPAVSLGWNITNESFFNSSVVNQLKLRYGIGESGNANIDANLWRQEYKLQTNGTWKAQKVINREITWETTLTNNVGLDMAFLNQSLTASIDIYNKETRDALLRTSLPPSTGFANYDVNKGKIRNRGIEVAIEYRRAIGDLYFSVAGNMAYNENKVLDLGESTYLSAGSYNRTYTDGPAAALYGYVADGLYRSQAEIDALNDRAKASGFESYDGTVAPGDIRFKDLNNDGTINENDQDIIGNPWPEFVYGFNVYLEYKGFDFSMNWQGVGNTDAYNTLTQYNRNMFNDWNSTKEVFNAWSPENPNSDIPRLGNASHNYTLPNSYMIEDASYLKLKNIQIGYSLDTKLLSKIKLKRLKIYAGLNNILTISSFTGMDPEFLSGSTYDRGVYRLDTYPQFRSVIFGLQVGI